MVCRIVYKDLLENEGHKISVYGERTDLESVLYVLGKDYVLTDVAIFDSKKKENAE